MPYGNDPAMELLPSLPARERNSVREGVRRKRGGEKREGGGRRVAEEAKGGRQTGVGIVRAPLWLVGHNRSH